ncbi:HEAT repeat domain-containing protein [Chamaesiphon polymorphus]|uniref:HEAT repeat domain-containing protein n=1 Tax=Chamaesiphon polymorphus CCALA 037 TaxID=2107692 RepID=A0A2T1GGK2_9CYAN|nr:HEAT repeat domain-containing protein [Chamaesiphon polymorphus]PSB56734.1 hypothetical protein C7B77_10870 [Chamaesiphon polymorphus CCALA 037]
MTSKIKNILLSWVSKNKDLSQLLRTIEDDTIRTLEEVQALLQALKHLVQKIQSSQYIVVDYSSSPLYLLAGLLQGMDFDNLTNSDGDTYNEVYHTVNSLADACEALIDRQIVDEGLPFACKVLALFNHPRNPKFIAQLATDDRFNDDFLWQVVFQIYTDTINSQIEKHKKVSWDIVDLLRDPLPQNFMGITYLDFSNHLATSGVLKNHPFNCSAGVASLSKWIEDPDPENFSYAKSATVAIPSIDLDWQTELLEIARKHSSPIVKIEVAWVLAKLDDPSGIRQLQEFAKDPKYAREAQSYLQEFGIVEDRNDLTFQAQIEMSSWLAHPQEFGRAPDLLELFDTRTIYWPPTDDKRTVWLFKYAYYQQNITGLGMVGSITFALFSETTTELSPEEAYALHCCWELEIKQDRRAPKSRTIAAGLKILRKHNWLC